MILKTYYMNAQKYLSGRAEEKRTEKDLEVNENIKRNKIQIAKILNVNNTSK